MGLPTRSLVICQLLRWVGRRCHRWAIAATQCRGQYGQGAPVPVGAVEAAARVVACDAGEKDMCCFNRCRLRVRHDPCGPRGGKARLSMGGREQTTVPDELGARGEYVAHGAPDELADVQRHSAFVSRALVSHPVSLVVLVTEGMFIRNGGAPARRGRDLGIVGNGPVLPGFIKLIHTHLSNKGGRGVMSPLSRSEHPPLALSLQSPPHDRHPHPQQAGSRPGLRVRSPPWRRRSSLR